MGGARRWLLSLAEVPAGTGAAAADSALVLLGGLQHLAVGFRAAVPAVFPARGSLPDRPGGSRAVKTDGDWPRCEFHRRELGDLRRPVPLAARPPRPGLE